MPGLCFESGNSWMIVPLDAYLGSGRTQAPAACPQLRDRRQTDRGAFLLPSRATGSPVLLVGSDSGAYVNGKPLPLGICALRDRDEILLTRQTARLYYTAESPATVVQFPGTERPVRCPRCTTEIAAGCPSVQCPTCGLWYHESEDLPCWTYAEKCRDCDQHTDLDGGYTWTPEGM